MKTQKGFTIIELIVVIAIIAILAAIVLVGVTQYIRESQLASALADMKNIQTIAVDYYVTNGNYSDLYTSSQIANIVNSVNKIDSSLYLGVVSENGEAHPGGTSELSGDSCGPGTWYAYLTPNSSSSSVLACADSTGFVGFTNTYGECSCTDTGE